MPEVVTAQDPRRSPEDLGRRPIWVGPRLTSALAIITLLTLASAGALSLVVVNSATPAATGDDLLALSVILGVPLSATLLSVLSARPAATIGAVLALMAVAGTAAGMAVGQLEINALPGSCDSAPGRCGLGLDSVTATILGAVLVGAGPVAIYHAIARSLRQRPVGMVLVYVMSLPVFALWMGIVISLSWLLTLSPSLPTD